MSPIMLGSKNSLLSSSEPNLQRHRSHSHILTGISVIAAVIYCKACEVTQEIYILLAANAISEVVPYGRITKDTNQNPRFSETK